MIVVSKRVACAPLVAFSILSVQFVDREKRVEMLMTSAQYQIPAATALQKFRKARKVFLLKIARTELAFHPITCTSLIIDQ